MSTSGWIKLWRMIFDSSLWMLRAEDRIVAITLMLRANTKDKEFSNKWGYTKIVVGRGELITSFRHLADVANLTVQNVRTAIKNLCIDGFCEIIRHNTAGNTGLTQQFTHIKILKYDEYQQNIHKTDDENNDEPNTATNKAPRSKLTTTKEERRERIKEERERGIYNGQGINIKQSDSKSAHSNSATFLLSEDFQLPDEWREYARQQGLIDVDPTVEDWKDDRISKGIRFLNVEAAFANLKKWLRNEPEFHPDRFSCDFCNGTKNLPDGGGLCRVCDSNGRRRPEKQFEARA